jgi:hypothetical protein
MLEEGNLSVIGNNKKETFVVAAYSFLELVVLSVF